MSDKTFTVTYALLCVSERKRTFVFLHQRNSAGEQQKEQEAFPLLSSIFRAKNKWSARRRCFSGVPAQYLAQDFAKLQRVGSPAHFADGHGDFLPAVGLSPPQNEISVYTHSRHNAFVLRNADNVVKLRNAVRINACVVCAVIIIRCRSCVSGNKSAGSSFDVSTN